MTAMNPEEEKMVKKEKQNKDTHTHEKRHQNRNPHVVTEDILGKMYKP